MTSSTRRAGVLLLLLLGAALLPMVAYAASQFMGEFRDWLQFLNLVLIPGTLWAGSVSARLTRVEKDIERIADRKKI